MTYIRRPEAGRSFFATPPRLPPVMRSGNTLDPTASSNGRYPSGATSCNGRRVTAFEKPQLLFECSTWVVSGRKGNVRFALSSTESGPSAFGQTRSYEADPFASKQAFPRPPLGREQPCTSTPCNVCFSADIRCRLLALS